MAILLERVATPRNQATLINRLLDKLGAMGVSVGKTAITPALNYVSPEEPRPGGIGSVVINAESGPTGPRRPVTAPFTPQGQAARQLRLMPKAPTTRGVPGLTDQKAAPAAPAAAPAASGAQAPDAGAPTNANARAIPMRCRWPPENSCG